MAEQSLTIVMKARDEASARMRSFQQEIAKGVQNAIKPFLAIGALLSFASKAAASAVEQAGAEQARAAAQAKGDIVGMLEAQIEVNTAVSQFGASIPVIGDAVRRMLDEWQDTSGIQAQIAEIKNLEKELEALHAKSIALARDAAIKAAQAEGRSASEIAALRAEFQRQDQARTLDEARMTEQRADDAFQAARENYENLLSLGAHVNAERLELARQTMEAERDLAIRASKERWDFEREAAKSVAAEQKLIAQKADDERHQALMEHIADMEKGWKAQDERYAEEARRRETEKADLDALAERTRALFGPPELPEPGAAGARPETGGPFNPEVQAITSRFLTRAQGVSREPVTAEDMEKTISDQTQALVKAIQDQPRKTADEFSRLIRVWNN